MEAYSSLYLELIFLYLSIFSKLCAVLTKLTDYSRYQVHIVVFGELRETDSRSFVNFWRVLRPPVSLYTPGNYIFQAKLENVKPLEKFIPFHTCIYALQLYRCCYDMKWKKNILNCWYVVKFAFTPNICTWKVVRFLYMLITRWIKEGSWVTIAEQPSSARHVTIFKEHHYIMVSKTDVCGVFERCINVRDSW